jgi:hypothetical protein
MKIRVCKELGSDKTTSDQNNILVISKMSILWFLLMRIFENGFGSFLRLGNITSLLAMNGPQSIRGYLSTTTIITDNNAKKINVIIFGGENTIATNNNALPPKHY